MNNKNLRITLEDKQNEFSYQKNRSNLNITFNRVAFIFFLFFVISVIYSIHLIHLGSRGIQPKIINKNILSNKTIIALVKQQQELLGNKGRILLRPSGTENLIRIMVESLDKNLINKIIYNIMRKIL